jgi:hypothetical protein
MRKMITALVAAGLLLTAACGGDDDDSADASGGGGGGGSSNSEFCEQATDLFNSSGDTADPEAQLAEAEALQDVAPDEIADDWQKVVEGSRSMAEATADIDPNDPNAAAQLNEQYQAQYAELMDATNNVSAYLAENCGLEGFTTSSSVATDLTLPPAPGG